MHAPERCTVTGEGGTQTQTQKPCSLTCLTLPHHVAVVLVLVLVLGGDLAGDALRLGDRVLQGADLQLLPPPRPTSCLPCARCHAMRRKEFSCSLVESAEETGSIRGHYWKTCYVTVYQCSNQCTSLVIVHQRCHFHFSFLVRIFLRETRNCDSAAVMGLRYRSLTCDSALSVMRIRSSLIKSVRSTSFLLSTMFQLLISRSIQISTYDDLQSEQVRANITYS